MAADGRGPVVIDSHGADEPLLAFLRLLADGASSEVLGAGLAEGLLREAAPVQVSVYLLDEEGTCLEEHVRYGAHAEPDHARVPVDLPLPLTEVFRTGRASATTMTEAAERFPSIAGWVRSQPDRADEVVYLVPVRAHGRPVGVLLAALPGPVDPGWRLGRLMDAAATALGVWALGRTRGDRARPRRARARGIVVTDRQHQIVDGVREGRSNAQIAADLDVSVGTVKSDLAALYRMFGVSDRDALAGLVPGAPRPDQPG